MDLGDINLQPKQEDLLHAILHDPASWIGFGGPRGGAKSGGLRRVALALVTTVHPGTDVIIIRRVYDEVRINHIEEYKSEHPALIDCYAAGNTEFLIPTSGGISKIRFGWADNLDDLKRKFMGPGYLYVLVDQAEQFIEAELRELKQMARWPGKKAKLVLFFNMGGTGIAFLRKVFHLHEVGPNETPEDFRFIHAYGWDNIEWSRSELGSDFPGLEPHEIAHKYYVEWTDAQRFHYFTTRSDYGRNLNTQDDLLRKRDLLGSWDILEGSYFAAVWEAQHSVVSRETLQHLVKYWWRVWVSMDWGRAHFCALYWSAVGSVGPEEARTVLGWQIDRPIDICITYREMVVQEQAEQDVAAEMVKRTTPSELKQMQQFVVSHEIFGKRYSARTIPETMEDTLIPAGFPRPMPCDLDRKGGWSLMYSLLLASKRKGRTVDGGQAPAAWLVGPDCPLLIEAMPLLQRDPKDLEDVKKVNSDRSPSDDVADAIRYNVKSMMDPAREIPVEERRRRAYNGVVGDDDAAVTARAMAMRQFEAEETRSRVRVKQR